MTAAVFVADGPAAPNAPAPSRDEDSFRRRVGGVPSLGVVLAGGTALVVVVDAVRGAVVAVVVTAAAVVVAAGRMNGLLECDGRGTTSAEVGWGGWDAARSAVVDAERGAVAVVAVVVVVVGAVGRMKGLLVSAGGRGSASGVGSDGCKAARGAVPAIACDAASDESADHECAGAGLPSRGGTGPGVIVKDYISSLTIHSRAPSCRLATCSLIREHALQHTNEG